MTIYRRGGASQEATLLARHDDKIRVAIKGGDDASEFREVRGTWVSEDCEPVKIVFEWQKQLAARPCSEEDFICPPETAAELIRLLLSGENVENESAIPAETQAPWELGRILC